MKSGLDHLPGGKQRELTHVVRVLFEEFAASTAMATQKWKKQGRILKIIRQSRSLLSYRLQAACLRSSSWLY